MQIALAIVLWYLIIVLSKNQRQALVKFVTELYETNKCRRKLKNSIDIYSRLYGEADSDYLRGFYYGKVGALEAELKEVKYFGC